MPPRGHCHFWHTQGPGTRTLTVLQTRALNSGIGKHHHSAIRSGLPCPYNPTLTLGWVSGFCPLRTGPLALQTGDPGFPMQDSGCHPR